jgi:hypothetical protein
VDDILHFFVAFVLSDDAKSRSGRREAFPRIFYRDPSLAWRCATHLIRTEKEIWIGKGDLKCALVDGQEMEYSAEETTNLPCEIQAALDSLAGLAPAQRDDRALDLVLRRAPESRFEAYADFLAPRRAARTDSRDQVNGGHEVACFSRANDPTSLRFAPGFEPDLDHVIEVSRSWSRLYGGDIRKFRIFSTNATIQYLFVAAPRQVWIIPPQAFTAQLSSYGVRMIDVHADEDLFVPGYEYHFVDELGLYTQIPAGFAGSQSEVDAGRADASPWLEALPVVQEFKEKVLGPYRTGTLRVARVLEPMIERTPSSAELAARAGAPANV